MAIINEKTNKFTFSNSLLDKEDNFYLYYLLN